MVPILIEGPAVEPVSLAELRLHLRLDGNAEDALATALARAARLLVEAAAGRLLISQRWRLVLDRWPARRTVLLPLSPLIAVERVRLLDEPADLDPALVEAEPARDPPRLVVSPAAPDPRRARGGILIEIRAGYGAAPDAVPEPLRQAIRLLVAHWFENRGDLPAESAIPPDLHALVAPYRRARL